MKQKKVYIAGPMRGYKHFNFPAFDKAEERLRALGYTVISPAAMDRLYEGWELYSPKDFKPCKCDFKRMMRRDLAAVDDCDCIYLLKGWEISKGAKVEKAYAEFLGIEVIYE